MMACKLCEGTGKFEDRLGQHVLGKWVKNHIEDCDCEYVARTLAAGKHGMDYVRCRLSIRARAVEYNRQCVGSRLFDHSSTEALVDDLNHVGDGYIAFVDDPSVRVAATCGTLFGDACMEGQEGIISFSGNRPGVPFIPNRTEMFLRPGSVKFVVRDGKLHGESWLSCKTWKAWSGFVSKIGPDNLKSRPINAILEGLRPGSRYCFNFGHVGISFHQEHFKYSVPWRLDNAVVDVASDEEESKIDEAYRRELADRPDKLADRVPCHDRPVLRINAVYEDGTPLSALFASDEYGDALCRWDGDHGIHTENSMWTVVAMSPKDDTAYFLQPNQIAELPSGAQVKMIDWRSKGAPRHNNLDQSISAECASS